MKTKKLLSILITMTLIFSFTACSKDAKEASSDEVVEIDFYEHTDSEAIVTALVEAYNAKSANVKVNLHIIANDDYDDKIKIMLSGKAGVDCLWLRGGGQAQQLAEDGALLSLNDLITTNDVDTSIYGNMGQAYVYDDNTYGLCTSKSCWLLWYNKDLFDAAGMDYPINLTWEEYSDLAQSLTTDELWGGLVPNWTMNLGASAAGEYLTDENLTRTMDYAKYLERWYVTDKSHPSIEEMTGSFDINSSFAEGNTYMMINGDWTFLVFPDADPQFTWAAAPLPIFEDAEEEATVGSSSCFSIAANCEYPEEAFDFIKFCCYSDEGASIYAENASVPANPSDAALEVYKEKVTVPGAEYVFSANVSLEAGLESYYEELNTAYKEELNDSLVSDGTLEEGFDNYKKRREEIIAK